MRGKTFSQTIYVWFYLVYLIVAGGLCLFMTPPFQSPDAINHFVRAVQISQGEVFIHRRSPTEVGSNIPASIIALTQIFDPIAFHPEVKVTKDDFIKALQLKWASPPAFVNLWNTDLYPPTSYVGSILAVKIARHLNIMPLATSYFAQLGNLIVDGGIGLLALLLAEEAAGFLLLLLSFPMSISLTASCSQDGMMIALSALAAACLLRFSKYPEKKWNPWLALVLAVALGCMGAGKAPYIALLPIVCLFGSKQNLKNLALISFLSLGIFLVWAVFDIHVAQVSFIFLPNVSSAGQISFLLHHKLHAIYLFTVGSILSFNFGQQIVGVLGWLDTVFPTTFYHVTYFTAALILLNSFFLQRTRILSWQFLVKFILFAGILFVSYDLIFLALYLTWTPVGLNVIEGTQGRYFLPLLMMLPLLPRLAPANSNSKTLYASYFGPYLEKLVLLAFMLYSVHTLYEVLSNRYW